MYDKLKKLNWKKNEIFRVICFVAIIVTFCIFSFLMLKKKELWFYEIKARLSIICFMLLFLVMSIYFELNKTELFLISVVKVLPSIILIYLFTFIPAKQVLFIPLLLPVTLIAIFYGTCCGIFLQVFAVTFFFFTDLYSPEICIFYMIFGLLVLYMMKYTKNKSQNLLSGSTIFIMYFIFSVIYQYMMFEKIQVLKLLLGIIPLLFSILPIYLKQIYNMIHLKRLHKKLNQYLKNDYFLVEKLIEKKESCYYHSLEVSDLAVKIAHKMKADVLLVNTAARYHEIGRLISNNYISAGVRVLEKYKFPPEVITIISEHNNKTNKPKTIESAIVMLSDSIVSTVNTIIEKKGIENVNRAGIVKNVIDIRMESGMLDESISSLNDYVQLKKSFLEEYR